MLYIIKYDERREGRPFGSDITTGFCSKFPKVKSFLGVGIFLLNCTIWSFFFSFFFQLQCSGYGLFGFTINGCVLNYIYEEL